jgi:hypothetical protein
VASQRPCPGIRAGATARERRHEVGRPPPTGALTATMMVGVRTSRACPRTL